MNILFLILIAVIVIAVIAMRKFKSENGADSDSSSSATQTPEPAKLSTEVSSESVQPAVKKSAAKKPAAKKTAAKKPAAKKPAVSSANSTSDLDQAIAALEQEKDALARHRLLQVITEETYKNRQDSATRQRCKAYSQIHTDEFASIIKPLKKANGGKLPHVTSFQNYATLLAEDGEYDQAIAICEAALAFGLDDKTKSGFAGRIERLQKQKAKA